MIPQRVQGLFDFIDYLDDNKDEFKKYIPLCNELRELYRQRDLVNPDKNYKDKLRYDELDTLIGEKFAPITKHIYDPITNKLRELDIWSGDGAYSSIWNNSSSSIFEFQNKFTTEEVIKVMEYKKMYLDFRTETNTDFLSLYSIFKGLDEILKLLFDFFKDTDTNEFENFEAKKIKVNNIQEALKISLESGRSISFSLPQEALLSQNMPINLGDTLNVYNKIVMGDNNEIGSISNNSGPVSVGKNIKTEVNSQDEFTKKSFNWQKWGVIIGTVIAILAIGVTILFSK